MGDNTAPVYRVTVWPEEWNRDTDVDPVFDARVNMEASERADLDHQLYRLVGEDYIGAYTIEDISEVKRAPFENVLEEVIAASNWTGFMQDEVRAFIGAGKKST